MSNNFVSWIGVLGVTFFAVPSILGGFQVENYDPISQYISETMAVDTQYGKSLRFFGYVPSGILLAIFSIAAIKKFPKSSATTIGFWGLSIFYGIATIFVGLFPCDKGCNKEFIDPSISQIIHNLTGLMTYIFVPISILIIGIGLHQSKWFKISTIAFVCAAICIVFNILLFSNSLTNYAGLIQRVIEGAIIIWIITCAAFIKRNQNLSEPPK